jgi:hypothetical protein
MADWLIDLRSDLRLARACMHRSGEESEEHIAPAAKRVKAGARKSRITLESVETLHNGRWETHVRVVERFLRQIFRLCPQSLYMSPYVWHILKTAVS